MFCRSFGGLVWGHVAMFEIGYEQGLHLWLEKVYGGFLFVVLWGVLVFDSLTHDGSLWFPRSFGICVVGSCWTGLGKMFF